MDEADGRPGAVALQFGHLDASVGAPVLFLRHFPSPANSHQNSKFTPLPTSFHVNFQISLSTGSVSTWQLRHHRIPQPTTGPTEGGYAGSTLHLEQP
jgi:hypothetical protein